MSPPSPRETWISPPDAAALIAADHGDPFAVLGLHEAGGRLVLRALVPGATTLWVIDRSSGVRVAELPRVHDDGLFAGPVGNGQGWFAYLLEAEDQTGRWTFEDPYRFGPLLGELDEYLVGEGMHLHLEEVLGAHLRQIDGVCGTVFAVWAPNARRVSVVGDFNAWDGRRAMMRRRGATGVWEIFVPGAVEGARYKYEIKGPKGEILPLKSDPVGFEAEFRPGTASIIGRIGDRLWRDWEWMHRRGELQSVRAPISIYEVHLGSWRRDGERWLSYRELAEKLVPYVDTMQFTHVELLPVSEHPFDGSWGYQPIGLFAPTSRFGTPSEFKEFIEAFHRAGIGVIVDWVPAHFPIDAHGLGYFDGTHLYEHADRREGFHPDWGTLIFNFGRREVGNYLIANALYWFREFHIDGLRVDAVASMLYRNYSRPPAQWIANVYGGTENLEAVEFLKRLNTLVYQEIQGVMTIAEESTSWPGVTRAADQGGLGFGYKWNMGWMNDTLEYMRRDPIYRRYDHNLMTFGLTYAFSENFILPLSHDEVVHGKGSLLGKMAGDTWQKFANLARLSCIHVVAPRQEAAVHGRRARAGPRMELWCRAGLVCPRFAFQCRRAKAGERPEPGLSGQSRAPCARHRSRGVLLDRGEFRGGVDPHLCPSWHGCRPADRGGRQFHARSACEPKESVCRPPVSGRKSSTPMELITVARTSVIWVAWWRNRCPTAGSHGLL